MKILHIFNLQFVRGKSLCMIVPNGAGKSEVLNSIFGCSNIFSRNIYTQINKYHTAILEISSRQKLKESLISKILEDK